MPRVFDPAIFDALIFDTTRRVTVFVPPPLTLADVLQKSHTPVARLEFLAADLETVLLSLDAQLVNGSVTSDRASDTFSSASVEVVNDDGTLTPSADSFVWSDRPVRISRGAIVENGAVLVPQITGIVATPTDGLATGSVSFSIASRFALAKRNFSSPTTTPAGRFRDAVRFLLELGGLGTSDALYDLDDGGLVVEPRTFDVNEEILGSVVKWVFDMACELRPTGSGVTRLRPVVDATAAARAWDFAGGIGSTLTDLKRQVQSLRKYNRQVVYGRGPDGYTISAQAIVTNPADPLFWRPDFDLQAPPYTSTDITTTAVAQAVAERLLRESSGYEEIFTAESVPVPLVAAGDVVSFSGAGFADPFLLDRVTMPIYKGAMQMQTRRTRSIAQ